MPMYFLFSYLFGFFFFRLLLYLYFILLNNYHDKDMVQSINKRIGAYNKTIHD